MNVAVIDRPGETIGHDVETETIDARHMTTTQLRRLGMSDDGGLAWRTRRLGSLPIGAHQMRRMMFGHEAHFACGWPRVVNHQIGDDRTAERGESLASLRADQCPRRCGDQPGRAFHRQGA